MPRFAVKPDRRNPEPPQEADAIPRSVSIRAIDLVPHERSTPHAHAFVGQLAWVMSGALRISTPGKLWFVLPSQGLWLPPGVMHGVEVGPAPVQMRNVYARPEMFEGLPDQVCILAVDRLLRELIDKTSGLPRLYAAHSSQERLMLTMMDQIIASTTYTGPVCSSSIQIKRSVTGEETSFDHSTPLSSGEKPGRTAAVESDHASIPMPTDPRLVRVCDALLSNPADDRSLAEWSRLAGASERTLARLFKTETGMAFGDWLRHLRILQACQRLMAGEPMSDIAYGLGYSSQSAFITMFKRVTGQTPTKYYQMMCK